MVAPEAAGLPKGITRRKRWFRLSEFDDMDRERLWEALDEFTIEKTRRESEAGVDASTGEMAAWVSAAGSLERLARQKAVNGEVTAAWSALKAAHRELLAAYGMGELRLEAQRLAIEADDKLHGWRKTAVDRLLSDQGRLDEAGRLREAITEALTHGNGQSVEVRVRAALDDIPSTNDDTKVAHLRTQVKASRWILDEALDNTYRRLQLLQIQVRKSVQALAVMLATTIVALAFAIADGWRPDTAGHLLEDLRSFLIVVVLGALSASLSGLLSLVQRDPTQRIPDVKAQWTLIRWRPVIGAVSAIIVVAILQSGIGGVSIEPQAALIAAFVAGFAERVVSRAVATAGQAIVA